jgi:hypothetical protein
MEEVFQRFTATKDRSKRFQTVVVVVVADMATTLFFSIINLL